MSSCVITMHRRLSGHVRHVMTLLIHVLLQCIFWDAGDRKGLPSTSTLDPALTMTTAGREAAKRAGTGAPARDGNRAAVACRPGLNSLPFQVNAVARLLCALLPLLPLLAWHTVRAARQWR